MCRGLIHALPADKILRGVIIQDEDGKAKLFPVKDCCVITMARTLKTAGAKILGKFRGYPGELAVVIDTLNDIESQQEYAFISKFVTATV